MSKIHPKGITPQKSGAVFTCNDPLKFKNGSGRKTVPTGVSVGPIGVTTGGDRSLVRQANANKAPPATKVQTSKSAATKMTQTATARIASGGSGSNPSVK